MLTTRADGGHAAGRRRRCSSESTVEGGKEAVAILSLPCFVSFPDDEQKPPPLRRPYVKLTYCAGCVREHVLYISFLSRLLWKTWAQTGELTSSITSKEFIARPGTHGVIGGDASSACSPFREAAPQHSPAEPSLSLQPSWATAPIQKTKT